MRRKADSLEGEEEQQEEQNPRDQKRSRTCLEGRGAPEGEQTHRTNDGVTTVTIPEELWADALRFLWESSCGSWHCSRSAGLPPRIGDHHERLSHNAVLQPYILQRQLDEQGEEGVDVADQKPKTTSTNVNRKKTSGECFFANMGECNSLEPLLQARSVCRLFKRLVDGMTGMDVLQPFAERVLARVSSPPSFFVSPHREDGGQGAEATEGVSSRCGWPWSQQQSEEGRADPQQALKVLSKAVMPAIKARFYACSLQARVEECLSQWWKPRFSSSSQLQQTIKRAQHLIQSRALRLIHLEREEDHLDISYALGIRAVLLISLSKLRRQPQGEEEEDIDNEEKSERQEEEDLVIALDVVQGWDYRDEAWDMGFFMRARLPSPPSSSQQDEATDGWRNALGIKQEEQKKERSEQKEDMEAEGEREEEGKNDAKENGKQEEAEELTAPLVILTVSRGSGEPTSLNKPLLRRLWQLLFQTNNSEEEEEEIMEAERSMFEFLSLCSSFFWKLDLDHVWLTRDEEEPYWSEPVQWMLNNKKEEEKGKQAAQQTSRARNLRRGKPASTLAESENLGFIDLAKQPEDPDWQPSTPETIAAVMKDSSLKEARAMLATLDKQHHLLSQASAEERYLWMYRQARCLQANIVASSSLVEFPKLCFSRFCGFSNLSVDSGEYSGLTVTRSSSILFSRPSSPSCNVYRVKLEAKEKNGNCYGDSCDSHSLTLTSTLNTFAMLLSESLRCAVQPRQQHGGNGGEGGDGEEKLTVIVKYDKDIPTHPLEDEEEDGEEKEAENEKNDSTCIPLHSLFQLPPSTPKTNEALLRHLLLGLGLRMLGIAPDANHDRERAEHEEEKREQKVTSSLWDLVRMLEQEPSATPFSADALWQQCFPFFRRASY
ncbi:hypothetical protein QOT17_007767 [Balamuthia mandrillaris]